MIARGSFGQPWIFDQTRDLLDGRPMRRRRRRSRSASPSRSITRAWRTTYEPDPRGAAIEFRKHLGWYVEGPARLGRSCASGCTR